MEIGRTNIKNEGQQMDQALHRVAINEMEEIKGTTMQTTTRLHNNGGNHLEQESSRQKMMESIDGGLRSEVDGQSLAVKCNVKSELPRLG